MLIVIKVMEKLPVLLNIILAYLSLNYNHFGTSALTQNNCVHQYPKRNINKKKYVEILGSS